MNTKELIERLDEIRGEYHNGRIDSMVSDLIQKLEEEKTERILITVDGGIVQTVYSTIDCDSYVLDLDRDTPTNKFINMAGEETYGNIYDVDCEVYPEFISHIIKQL